MRKLSVFALASICALATACGASNHEQSRVLSRIQQGDVVIETIEVSSTDETPTPAQLAEIQRALATQNNKLKTSGLTNSTVHPSVLEDTIGDRIDTINKIINAFADIMKKVVAPDTPLMKGTVIAEARPVGLEPMALQNSKYAGKTFKKRFKSLLGFTLVETEYKVTYAYGADNNGKGQYIPYVLFTPMKIVLDRLWHLEADSLSLAPRNCGTIQDPIAAIEFNLSFKAKGLTGTIMATDTFSLNANTGELIADGRDFQP